MPRKTCRDGAAQHSTPEVVSSVRSMEGKALTMQGKPTVQCWACHRASIIALASQRGLWLWRCVLVEHTATLYATPTHSLFPTKDLHAVHATLSTPFEQPKQHSWPATLASLTKRTLLVLSYHSLRQTHTHMHARHSHTKIKAARYELTCCVLGHCCAAAHGHTNVCLD